MKMVKILAVSLMALAANTMANAKDVKIEKELKQCLNDARDAGFEAVCYENAANKYENKIMRSSRLYHRWVDLVEQRCGQDTENDSSAGQANFYHCRVKVARSVMKK